MAAPPFLGINVAQIDGGIYSKNYLQCFEKKYKNVNVNKRNNFV